MADRRTEIFRARAVDQAQPGQFTLRSLVVAAVSEVDRPEQMPHDGGRRGVETYQFQCDDNGGERRLRSLWKSRSAFGPRAWQIAQQAQTVQTKHECHRSGTRFVWITERGDGQSIDFIRLRRDDGHQCKFRRLPRRNQGK